MTSWFTKVLTYCELTGWPLIRSPLPPLRLSSLVEGNGGSEDGEGGEGVGGGVVNGGDRPVTGSGFSQHSVSCMWGVCMCMCVCMCTVCVCVCVCACVCNCLCECVCVCVQCVS